MNKLAATAGVVLIALFAIAAPAAAYTQKTTYPGGYVNFNDGICRGYGSSETDFAQTIRLGENPNSCDFIKVRANYKNGAWVGYSSWRIGTSYIQFVPGGSSRIQFGQHGLDAWR